MVERHGRGNRIQIGLHGTLNFIVERMFLRLLNGRSELRLMQPIIGEGLVGTDVELRIQILCDDVASDGKTAAQHRLALVAQFADRHQ